MSDPFFHPVSGFDLPRFAGVPTFMRLPYVPPGHERFGDVQVGLIGVPWDSGTTNRPGPRHGPRQLRDASTMIRAQHATSGMRPFETVNCADLGDVGPNPADIQDSMERITAFYDNTTGILTLTGTDTASNYQQVLGTLTYNNTSNDPDEADRVIHVTIHDGTDTSNTLESIVTVTAVNAPPGVLVDPLTFIQVHKEGLHNVIGAAPSLL